ncbi:MAG: STAS domain-containing protein [Planctomycetes bacterium]|jgi:anti-sigma B factor antagonist|nr:STAS domain-containing protein [Planctomycetota bacterium]HON44150.1 STAS domain-containing protein [Planctomycetota bacterium]HPY75063.1 STAS domain-containing protein [Planctomycetota bacterium]HQB00724.1 STAS domain-containing protein [Planctomycetota bacterium]HRU50730.1 STAS domain-containing protein [Planctomycetota bacterium]
MAHLSIDTKRIADDIAYIKITGSLDATTYEKMEKQLEAFFSNDFFKLMVNMEDIHYISSAGAGIFIASIGTAQDHDGDIILINPSAAVQDVFEILGLAEIFTFASSIEEAETLLS